MTGKIEILKKTIKETDIILWKNITKDPSKINYNITISKKGMLFLAVSSINKKDVSFMIAKYNSTVEWVEYMVKGDNDG